MNDLVLRSAAAHDAEAVAAIYAHYVEHSVATFDTAPPPQPAYRHTLEDTVYLAPDHVGRGTGRLLLTELVARAAESGAHQLVAVISTGEDSPSARLHRALGFETAGRLREVGYKFDRWIDILLMQRAIGPAHGYRVPARG